MSIQERINDQIKLSMKEKNTIKLAALRSVKSAILLELTKDGKTKMNDQIVIQIISKLVKQRKESASIYRSKNREDLEKEELEQIKYLEVYLPTQLTEDEIEKNVSEKLDEISDVSFKDMGRIMGVLMKEMSGKADGKIQGNQRRQPPGTSAAQPADARPTRQPVTGDQPPAQLTGRAENSPAKPVGTDPPLRPDGGGKRPAHHGTSRPAEDSADRADLATGQLRRGASTDHPRVAGNRCTKSGDWWIRPWRRSTGKARSVAGRTGNGIPELR